LDAANVRKRAATKGDAIVEMKKDEVITGLSVAWTVERYVALSPKGKAEGERKQKAEGGKQKAAPAKKAAVKKKAAPAKGKKKK
jgi:hypothetical protein